MMTSPAPPRRSWFAVWRWKWWTWAIILLMSFPVYVVSEPLAHDFGNIVNDQYGLGLKVWMIHQRCYAPVHWARDNFPSVNEFLLWERHMIARGRQQWFLFWNPPSPELPVPPDPP